MPSRAARRCPRCRQTYTGPKCTRCTKRDDAYRAARADDLDRYYSTAEWQRISRHYLNHHPACVLCGAPSKVADHYPKSRRQLVAEGITNPDTWRRLRPLCIACHRTETNRLQPGGFIRHPERY